MRPFLLCAAFALGSSPAFAQTDLTALSLTAQVYESVPSWQERAYRPAGLVELVQRPGHVMVDLRAVFDGPWTDDLERLSVQARDIRLILPDGTEQEVVGHQSNWGQPVLRASALTGRRPRDFPDDGGDIHWNALFVVPKGVATATLRIGGDANFQAPVTLPSPTTLVDAASFATFTPTGLRRFQRVNLEDGRDGDLVTSHIAAPPGMALAEITLRVAALAANETDGDARFSWNTHNFRLVDDRGQTLGLVGERFLRRILDSQFNGVDVGDDTERVMVWAVPADLPRARLLFGETEVAQIDLASAPVTPTD